MRSPAPQDAGVRRQDGGAGSKIPAAGGSFRRRRPLRVPRKRHGNERPAPPLNPRGGTRASPAKLLRFTWPSTCFRAGSAPAFQKDCRLGVAGCVQGSVRGCVRGCGRCCSSGHDHGCGCAHSCGCSCSRTRGCGCGCGRGCGFGRARGSACPGPGCSCGRARGRGPGCGRGHARSRNPVRGPARCRPWDPAAAAARADHRASRHL
mmetsp:Transcript_38574/g.120033  ORF Transcript_38574/g.120033 Transcript_38574/m.120033 type:complete len:206 (+) Transcript_38574:109-726(+)